MTKLWKNGHFAADHFVVLEDAAPLVSGGPLLVSLQRWRQERAAITAASATVGVIVPAATVLSDADALGSLAMIAVPFPKFNDGRGYSLARRLRDQFMFRGEVRATGEVLLDQLPLMLRCGFDSFAVSHAPTLRALEGGHLPFIAEVYQNAVSSRAHTAPGFVGRPLREAAE